MHYVNSDRNMVVGFRATRDFTRQLDQLCQRLGHRRSAVVRYALNQFMRSNWNNPEQFNKVRHAMY